MQRREDAIGDRCRARARPPGPSGKVDRPPLLPPEFHDLELGGRGFIADAGNHRQLQARDDGNPVRARAGVEHGPRFHTVTIELCQTRCSAVGYEHMARIGHHAGRLRKARQGHEVSAAVMLDDLDAVARRKRHKDAAGLRVKGSMVEKGRSRTGYLDHSHGSQRHGGLLPYERRCGVTSAEQRGPSVCNVSYNREGKDEMTKASIDLQDLRRRLYVKAKAETSWRLWGLYVHVCKLETLRAAYVLAQKNDGAPG